MAADWLFDESGNENDWRIVATRAGESLVAAAQALERADVDELTDRDKLALERALSALGDARRSLQALDQATLVDAESLVRETLERSSRPAALVVHQA